MFKILRQHFDRIIVRFSCAEFYPGPLHYNRINKLAVTMQLARELHVGRYNDVRQAFGLERHQNYEQIVDATKTTDPERTKQVRNRSM